MLNNLLQIPLKLFQKEILIENKIADRITKVSKTSPNNNSRKNEEEILRERQISPGLRHKLLMI